MPQYFMKSTPLAGLERQMMTPPSFLPRGGGTARSRFHYRKEDVDAYIEKLEAEEARLEDGRKDGPAVRQGSALIESAELKDFIFLGGEEETEAGGGAGKVRPGRQAAPGGDL